MRGSVWRFMIHLPLDLLLRDEGGGFRCFCGAVEMSVSI
uniref:Uncharacterized protein n=1 Tax=Setaria italica TaxID=4555 RepID=K4A3N9_SETIT